MDRKYFWPVGIALVCGACVLRAAAAPPEARVPELKTDGTQWVSIFHPQLGARWRVQFPETVLSSEAFYLMWEATPREWRKYPGNGIGYDWVAPPQWLEHVRASGLLRGLPIAGDLLISARLQPSPDRVDLFLELTNLSGAALQEVSSDGGCFQHQSEKFIDNDASRTLIRTERGLSRLSELPRSQRIRCAYFFDPRWYEPRVVQTWEFFWGRSEARPTSALIATISSDGSGAVGIGYEHSFRLMQNSDAHHCMHSAPFYGTLLPGQKISRRGVILFGRSAEELFRRFEALQYRPDFVSPAAAR